MQVVLKPLKYSTKMQNKYYGWFNDAEVLKYLDKGTPREKIDIRSFLTSVSSDRDPGYLYFSIVAKHLFYSDIVGHVGLKDINPAEKSASIGIVIGDRTYWGRGIGTKALKLILQEARKKGIQALYARIRVDHVVSKLLFTKAGFKFDKNYHENREIYKLEMP